MEKKMKPTLRLGFGVLSVILIISLMLGVAGELKPAQAMDLQATPAPVANPDTFGFKIGATNTRTVAAPGVLANDTDGTTIAGVAEVISAIPVTNGATSPAGTGTYTLYADGSFTYTPSSTVTITTVVTFNYTVIDDVVPQLTSTSTVTLKGSNYDIQDDRYGFRTGVFRYIYPAVGVLSNDGTAPALPTGATVQIVPGSGPNFGSLSPTAGCLPASGNCPTSGLQPNGSFTYYPNTSGALTDQFQYTVWNGTIQIGGPATVLLTNSVTCTVDLQINDEAGQGDLTQFCRDTYYEGVEKELAMSVNWDETNLGGTNSADACALFDTTGDRESITRFA